MRRPPRNVKHGHAVGGKLTSEYLAWHSMLARCYGTSNTSYRDYGGRGITVCDRWRASFTDFFADMGQKPSPTHSLDRINNDAAYEPRNCRWATKSEQAKNRRRPRHLLSPS